MLTKDEAVRRIREHAPVLRQKYGLHRIGIFGSVAREKQRPGSDVDVVVEFDKPIGLKFMDFADDLEEALGEKVDVLTPAGIDSIRQPAIAESIRNSIINVYPD